ncbi:MAG TPA: hypothetical protein VJ792_04650 [Candidatus Nitrosotalea sp.]|nr:hypothetical protein [Candidatus Nitrosotalea sp.]
MKSKVFLLLALLPLVAFSAAYAVTGSSEWDIDNQYAHVHASTGHPVEKICGSHICKPGEKYTP